MKGAHECAALNLTARPQCGGHALGFRSSPRKTRATRLRRCVGDATDCSALRLAAAGINRIVRTFPRIGGIDFTGAVADSRDERFREGDEVISPAILHASQR